MRLIMYSRGRSGLSQLNLTLGDVSARYVSYLETGRVQPSEAMVLSGSGNRVLQPRMAALAGRMTPCTCP